MNTAKTVETLKGLLDLETGDSITIASFGEKLTYPKKTEEYDLTLRIIRADAQTKEPAADKAGKHPAGIIIP